MEDRNLKIIVSENCPPETGILLSKVGRVLYNINGKIEEYLEWNPKQAGVIHNIGEEK